MKALSILLLILSLNYSCGNNKNIGQEKQSNNTAVKTDESRKIVKKYGFQFSIPKNWENQETDLKAIDLKGQIKSIETSYVDANLQSCIKLIFHPDKAGLTLYNYYNENKSIKSKHFNIAGQSAIMIKEQLTRDGKGHILPKPLIRHKIYLLSPNHKGLLEIVYNLPKNNIKAKQAFEHFIQKIQPIK